MDLETLKSACLQCNRCSLCATRTNVVFGVGPADAEVLFVGEGPGQQEDLTGQPFVGPAGQLLDDMLSIIGMGRHNCYIANIVKCRPPRNRDPRPQEQEACFPYLENQIDLLDPKIIVCLGRIAGQKIMSPQLRITFDHGRWHYINERWMMAMYHPSALLRDVSKRPETFDDLLALRKKMRELGMI